jgi:hypothetical protein
VETIVVDMTEKINFPYCFISGESQIINFMENNNDLNLVWFLCDNSCEEKLMKKYPHIATQMLNVDQFGVSESVKYSFAIKHISEQSIR